MPSVKPKPKHEPLWTEDDRKQSLELVRIAATRKLRYREKRATVVAKALKNASLNWERDMKRERRRQRLTVSRDDPNSTLQEPAIPDFTETVATMDALLETLRRMPAEQIELLGLMIGRSSGRSTHTRQIRAKARDILEKITS